MYSDWRLIGFPKYKLNGLLIEIFRIQYIEFGKIFVQQKYELFLKSNQCFFFVIRIRMCSVSLRFLCIVQKTR